MYLAVVFSIRRVPDWVLQAIGGPSGVTRDGGLILRYRPPESYDLAKLERRAERRGATLRREAGDLVLEDRPPRSTAYLIADQPAQLTDTFAQLRAPGWRQPPHSIIAFGREPRPDDKTQRVRWRSYLLGDQVLLDGDAVEGAAPSLDPYTGRSIVFVDFDRNGAERFPEITARLVSHQQAILAGGEVRDAPIINCEIPDGHMSISMGLFDPDRQARAAATLATALTVVTLPPGGVVEDQTWVPPPSIPMFLVIARLVIGIIGGALAGLLVGITVRATRPVWQQVVRRPAGRFPIKRLAVTMLAPVALLVLGRITLPGINARGLPDLFDAAACMAAASHRNCARSCRHRRRSALLSAPPHTFSPRLSCCRSGTEPRARRERFPSAPPRNV